MLLEDDALLVYPTVSASFAILKNLSIGAGFVWGVAKFSFSSMSAAVSTSQEEFKNDLKAKISGFDGFIPGFVVSMLYSPLRRLDLAAWYHFSDAIRSEVDLFAQANYYNQGGRINEQAINDPANITDKAKVGSFKARIPMEARLGLRYHHPRSKYAENRHTHPWVDKHGGYARDAMAQDLFDVELDMSWSHNSAVEAIEIRMQRDVRINGTPGYLPENADSPRQWRDVLGVRVGGEYVVIPDFLALRAGGFFESKGVDDAFLSLDFHQGFKAGVAGGVTVRITRVDISAAYQHTFFGALDNGGKGQVRGLSGDATTNYRTTQFVNGGRATSSLNEVALGVTVHF
jgi:long-chain fatty acid transport protein